MALQPRNRRMGLGVPSDRPTSMAEFVPTGNPNPLLNANRPQFRGGLPVTGQEDWAPAPAVRQQPTAPAVRQQPTAPAPPVTLAAPPPASLRAPAPQVQTQAFQVPNMQDVVAQGIETAEATPPRGVYSDALTPQYSAANTRENGIPAPGSGAGLSVVGSFGGGNIPIAQRLGISGPGVGAGAPSQPQQTQPLVIGRGTPSSPQEAFMQAVQRYQGMNDLTTTLPERGRALNALRALAPVANAQTGAQASMYGDDVGAQSRLAAAGIGANAQLQAAQMGEGGALERALLQAMTQQRGQDIEAGLGQQRIGLGERELDLAEAGAQPSPMDVLAYNLTLGALENGEPWQNVFGMTQGEAPTTGLLTMQPGEIPVGMQQGAQISGLSPELQALLVMSGAMRDPQAR